MGSDRDAKLAMTETAAAPGPVQPRPVEAMLGQYRLDGVLGSGGMGRVHAAFDLDLERRVAIKVLHGDPEQGSRLRLMREARAMARLDHPNVVKIYEVDSSGGVDFVVMELVAGGSLATWLEKSHSPRAVIDAFIAAGRGLAAAHAVGMVHRDFKPQNVLRSDAGAIKVGDFGLARDAAEVSQPGQPHLAEATPNSLGTLTQTGAMVGTPAYMAPEQWAIGTISAAADQFSFCVALWEALSGKRPFDGATTGELRAAIEAGPSSLDTNAIPRPYRAAILRGLAVDPRKRWPSIDALLAALEPAPKSRRGPWLRALAIVALVVVTGIVGITWQHASSVPPAPPTPPNVPASVEEGTVNLPRATVERALRDHDGATFTPLKDEDGETSGMRVVGVKPGSFVAQLGLRDNDTITEISDIELSEASLPGILALVRAQDELEIVGTRNGSGFAIAIHITP